VADDKGGMAVMIAALRAMQAAGTLKDANIEVVLTGDEEDAGEPTTVARADLVAAGRRADAALDFEGLSREDGKDMGSIARRSSNSWTLTVTAKSGHSSAVFSPAMGDGAIYAAARIIAAIREEVPEPNLTLNVGLIAGGAEATLAPDAAHVAAAGKTNRAGQGDRAWRPALAQPRAGPAGDGADARDRGAHLAGRAGGHHVRGRLSADGADARQPGAAGAAQRRERNAGPAGDGPARSAEARRG
jgi:hypothetical protein